MDINESHTPTTPMIIGEKVPLANGTSSQKTHDDRWADKTSPILSRMNSMECWDYTIELECLNGPEG